MSWRGTDWDTLWNWVGGERVAAQDGTVVTHINPAYNQPIGTIPRSKKEDVEAAVLAAKQALEGPWKTTSTGERADFCDAIADALEVHAEELAFLESRDTGKPESLAARIDIPRAIHNFRFFAGAVRHQRSDFFPMADAFNYTLRRPVGVVGLITPWNLPLYLLTWKVAPALAMGNTIVAKPSEMTPTTATFLGQLMTEVGLPTGVFNLVHGLGPEVGQAIVEHPDVTAISFTGGTATGRRVAATAAPLFKKLSLELGGKNPNIVFADCDWEAALAGTVRAAFTNQGQVCLCGSRVLVERSIYDEFVAAFVEKVKAMRVGDPRLPETQLGALISQEHRDKVERYVALAEEEGGLVLCGGKRPSFEGSLAAGAFYEPTVIAGLSPQCRTVQEEIFGPVVTVHPFDSEDEALRLANEIRYGLCASVWTQDLGRAHRMSEMLETGMVWVNTWLHRDLRVPFGGVKESGVGREGGAYSLSFFSEARNVCIFQGRTISTSLRPKSSENKKKSTPKKGSLMSSDKGTTLELGQREIVHVASQKAPKPVGAYPHARRVGELLYLSGIGPRQPETDEIPGGPIEDKDGNPLDYDAAAQTRAVIQNVKAILEASGSSFEKIVDVQVFLVDMKRDFSAYNAVYQEFFQEIQATRTTVAIRALPTPIAVEFKVIAFA